MARKDAILNLRQVLIKRRDALRKALAGDLSLLKELREQSTGDVVDAAVARCEETQKQSLGDLSDRIKRMVERFAEFGVKREQIERRLGHKLESTGGAEILNLAKVYTSIKNGMAEATEYFPPLDASTATAEDETKAAETARKASDGSDGPF